MNRRDFLKTSLLSASGMSVLNSKTFAKTDEFYLQAKGKIVTVTGILEPAQSGNILPHEHVMSNFGGPPAEPAVYENDKLLKTVIPYLEIVKSHGGKTLVDCTTAYFGRDPELLKQISVKTGINILTNTGYYGAADDRYVPDHAKNESAEELSKRWLEEWEYGIRNTGIRPGFLKIGVDSGSLSEMDSKLVRTAAKVHKKSGMVMAIHTGDNPESALAQIEILKQEGVHPSAWIWVHAHNVKDKSALLEAAKAGAWIEFDGLKPDNKELHLEMVQFMVNHGYMNQVMLSHDGNSFRYGDKPLRPYHQLFDTFTTFMGRTGFSKEEIDRIVTDNPQRAFTIQKRLI